MAGCYELKFAKNGEKENLTNTEKYKQEKSDLQSHNILNYHQPSYHK